MNVAVFFLRHVSRFYLQQQVLLLLIFLFIQNLYIPSSTSLYCISPKRTIDRETLSLEKKRIEKTELKILFILPWMIAGGMERAFISMLQKFPIEKASIQVVLLKRGGDFESLLPSMAKVISLDEATGNEYDIAVSYAQWINPEKWLSIKAKRRIQWVHSDVRSDHNALYFKRLMIQEAQIDNFIVVSHIAKKNFDKYFPKSAYKSLTILNIINNEEIRRLSCIENIQNEMPRGDLPNVLTVARLSKEKRLDLAIAVHKYLEDRGIHFRWFIIGEGSERENLEDLIMKNGLQGKCILLGRRENPYPYIKETELFVLLSRAEGFGLVITEAKILGKPVLVTDFKASREQIQSGINGLIVQSNVKSIAEGIQQLLVRADLRAGIEHNLAGYEFDNSISLHQLTQLFTVSQ